MKLTRRKLVFAAALLFASGTPLIALFFNSPYRTVDVHLKIDVARHASVDLSLNNAIDALSEQIRRYPRVTRFSIEWAYSAISPPDGITPDGLWRFALRYNRKTRTVTTLVEGIDGTMLTTGSVGHITDEVIYSWSKTKNKIPEILRLHSP